MTRFKLHHHLPLIGRPFRQRNQARLERDQAVKERDELRNQLAAPPTLTARPVSTVPPPLYVPPGHFFSPVVDPVEADQHISGLEANPIPLLLDGIKIDREEMIQKCNTLLTFLSTIPFPQFRAPGFRYAFENPSYSWGDGSILYAMLRSHQPRRVIEVGSGWSSACALDTADRYFKNECEFTFVDPHPQLLNSLIGNLTKNVSIVEKPVQQVPLSVFETLEAEDILFIDSTHVLRTGSDVCFELFEVLPRLAPGVLIHFHDIFWPFEYPRLWAVDQNRSWNELYAIRAFLTNNDDLRVVFFNDYFAKTERNLITASYPDFLKNSGGALWVQRI
jgi:predicted O-methyltransferase YrrM